MTRTALVTAGALAMVAAAGAALLRLAAAPPPAEAPQDGGPPDALPPYLEDFVAGGHHVRFETDHGPVHVWMPIGFDAATGGTVVYVHGYYTDVDGAFAEHHLAEQFRDSGRNALFVVPEAPSGSRDRPRWYSLGELLRTVHAEVDVHRPWGPVVAVGHSGAYRTILQWVEHYELEHIILLDAVYGADAELSAWLDGFRGHTDGHLIVIGGDTFRWTEPMARERDDVVALDRIPERATDLPPSQRRARFLYMRPQYGHSEMVENGRVIPMLLRLTALPPVP